MPLPNKEDEARLSVLLTAMLEGVRAKNEIAQAAISFVAAAKSSQPQDADKLLAHIDAALEFYAKAVEEARLFRHLIRDERKPLIRHRARDQYQRSTMSRLQHDPKDIVRGILGNYDRKNPPPAF